ncbi:radical SAM protein [Candidatus Parcubacteria bacterium]|nr:radical SAM protein [Candidatus Parcubacteria bacterium]
MTTQTVLNAPRGHARKTHPSELVAEFSMNALRGLKVVFINMPLRETATPNTPPQGPGLMAARLRMYGAEPTIVDLNAYRLKDKEAEARGLPGGRHLSLQEAEVLLITHFNRHGEPDIIAFSGMITTLRWQENLGKVCRRLVPDSFIVSGGGLATEVKTPLLSWIPELDAIADSEGDDVILLLANEVKKAKERGRGTFSSMTGSGSYIGDLNGKPVFMYKGDRPNNLDELPFAAWDLLHEDVLGNRVLDWYIGTPVWGLAAKNSSATPFSMERSLTTVSSRGCPFACRFCFRGGQGERNYGIRSAENLRAEAEWLIKTYGVDFIGFPDDNFAVDTRRMKTLPEAFAELPFRWGTHTRLDEADERLIPMAESGCIYIGFGAESASEHVLTEMGKGGFILKRGTVKINGFDFPKTMVDGITMARQVGIHSNCTWIMAYPGEALEHLKTSVAFILWQIEEAARGLISGTPEYENAVASINQRMFVATAYPGTEMFRHPKVQSLLSKHFGIVFGPMGDPLPNEALRSYILELDDATKVLHGTNGEPINFGDMPLDIFLEARDCADSGSIDKILNM